jgi:hypothetical protein
LNWRNKKMGMNITPSENPGQILVYNPMTKQTELIDVTDWTEGPMIDSEIIPAGTAVGAGFQLVLFTNLNHTLTAVAKIRGIETTMTRPNQLPAQWEMIVTDVNLGILSDQEVPIQQSRLYNISVFGSLITNEQRVERYAPMYYHGFPYGLSGNVSVSALGPVERNTTGNGAIAPTAHPRRIPILIKENMTFTFPVTFGRAIPAVIPAPAGPATCVTVYLTALLSGFINKPLM